MKTLTILFESPNVFYAVIDGVNIRIKKGIEEVKYACYQSDQRITGPCNLLFWEESILKPGDIFQVDGFDYEEKTDYIPISRGFSYKKEGSDQIKQCDLVKNGIGYYDNGKVAILKLAKEEEPKCQCSNDLEYSNCSINCERHNAEVEEESFFIKAYNQAIDDVLKLYLNTQRGYVVTSKEIEKLKK